MGELFRPGKPVKPPLEPIRPPLPRPGAKRELVMLECTICGKVFTDIAAALMHQEEHYARGEKTCFRLRASSALRTGLEPLHE